eukprot:TRINITY_DN1588_c0_g1_i1.p1 TRINITY_DN1588_c0_g1~~TRINITY_DN1588_c0_g1_i1.p1  ORF type:complete len:538 (+),score=100.42 TRINITY_DN1588_c0_g1_i1:100-1713(+)
MGRCVLTLFVFVLIGCCLTSAHAQCYLEDAAADCAVCWSTSSHGVTTFKECPENSVQLTWEQALPAELVEGESYHTKFQAVVDTTVFDVQTKEKKGDVYHVPHANIHSCIRSRGACTPFVSNSPGLATHTPEIRGNGTYVDNTFSGSFETDVQLTKDEYTIIAHVRFYVPDATQDESQACFPECLTKVDTAIGIVRSVVEAKAETSTDAYISAGFVGGVLLTSLGSIVWGARTGRLNIHAILESVTRPEVTLTCEVLLLLGDMIAFTVGVEQEVFVDPRLADVIPFSVLALVVGWLVTGYQLLQTIYGMKFYISLRRRMDYEQAACDILLTQEAVHSAEDAAKLSSQQNLASSAELCALLQEHSLIKRDVKDVYLVMCSLFLADLPLVAIATYIIMVAGASDVMVVVALILSSMAGGGKASRLGSFNGSVKAMRTLETAFVAQLYVQSSMSCKTTSLQDEFAELSSMMCNFQGDIEAPKSTPEDVHIEVLIDSVEKHIVMDSWEREVTDYYPSSDEGILPVRKFFTTGACGAAQASP